MTFQHEDPATMGEGEDDDGRFQTPKSVLLGGKSAAPAPVVVDPEDGLPRPLDEGFTAQAVLSATDATFVCTEGGPWQVVSERDTGNSARSEVVVKPDQPALTLDEDALILDAVIGGRRVYRIAGGADRYVRARPPCVHYVEAIVPATDLNLESHTALPQTLLRACQSLDLALSDQVVFSCNQRSPRDIVSEAELVRWHRRKAKQAAEANTTMFRTATPADARKNGAAEPAQSEVKPVSVPFQEGWGTLFVEPPSTDVQQVLRHAPHHIYFTDRAWQPIQETYNGVAYVATDGKEGVFSAPLSGEVIVRSTFEDGATPDRLTGLQRAYFTATVKRLAEVLQSGRNVVMVPYHVRNTAPVLQAIAEAVGKLAAAPKDGEAAEKENV